MEFDGFKLFLKLGVDFKGIGDVDGMIGMLNWGFFLVWYVWIWGESVFYFVRKLYFFRIDY